jgi:hypothetical protein
LGGTCQKSADASSRARGQAAGLGDEGCDLGDERRGVRAERDLDLVGIAADDPPPVLTGTATGWRSSSGSGNRNLSGSRCSKSAKRTTPSIAVANATRATPATNGRVIPRLVSPSPMPGGYCTPR